MTKNNNGDKKRCSHRNITKKLDTLITQKILKYGYIAV
jgi:hypothetical protein